MSSVNTNYGALVALQNLNATNKQLDQVQNRINTGLKVASAKDNGAVFAIAEGLRTRVGALAAVNDGIDRTNITIDTALNAGASIGDVLKQLKDKASAAQGAGLSADQKAVLQADFDALRQTIDKIANAATFNGANLVNGTNTGGNALSVLTTDTGGGSSGGGFYITGGPGDTATTGALTLNTVIKGTAGIGIIGVTDADADYVAFTLFGADGVSTGTDNRTFNVAISSGDTIEDYIANVNAAGNGELVASFDSTNGRITYTSSQAFSADYTEAGGGTDEAAALEQIFAGGAAQTSVTASRYTAGGGYQTSTAALASGTTTSTLISQLEATDNNDEAVSFTFGTGASQKVFNVSLDGVATLGDFLSKVSTATNGLVTANYDSTTRTINYRSEEQFTAAAVGTFAGSANFVPSPAQALLAPTGSSATSAGSTLTVSGYDFRVGRGALSTVTESLDVSTDAAGASAAIDTAIQALNVNLAKLGSQSKALDTQKEFLTKLSDNVEKGIGALVDADLAKESARLQALQIKQQLGAQALSIANQQPSILLSFFR
jgi:flagellin